MGRPVEAKNNVREAHYCARNRLHLKEEWMEQDDDKKREVLKWARKSEAADKVKQMEKDYDKQVEQFRKIIVED